MTEAGPFFDGRMCALSCLGEFQTHPEKRFFLDGRTGDGSVALAPELTRAFSGTKWRSKVLAFDKVVLECQGAVEGPRFLDGHTVDHSVHLAPSTDRPFTGTVWQIVDPNNDTAALKCLGTQNPNLFLDGLTGNSTVRFSDSTASVHRNEVAGNGLPDGYMNGLNS